METHEITTSKGEFVVVDYNLLSKIDKILIDGDSRFIKLSEATGDDAKGVVDEPLFGNYKSYISCFKQKICSGDYVLKEAVHSLHSLLKSKGIDVNNGNWYLFKKLK